MAEWKRDKPTGELPKAVTPNLLWTGGCLSTEYQGELASDHFLNLRKAVLVDTGHASHWKAAEKHVEDFLGDRPLDYIFPTASVCWSEEIHLNIQGRSDAIGLPPFVIEICSGRDIERKGGQMVEGDERRKC